MGSNRELRHLFVIAYTNRELTESEASAMENPPDWMLAPVWHDIAQGDTLQKKSAREERDEKHICPLQLTVIDRCIEMWSAPGDLVASWYGGIGSDGFVAVKKGRRALLWELKKSYWEQGCRNLESAEKFKEQAVLPFSEQGGMKVPTAQEVPASYQPHELAQDRRGRRVENPSRDPTKGDGNSLDESQGTISSDPSSLLKISGE